MSQLRSPLAEGRTGRPFTRLLTVVAALAAIHSGRIRNENVASVNCCAVMRGYV